MINYYVKNPSEKLMVLDKDGVQVAMKQKRKKEKYTKSIDTENGRHQNKKQVYINKLWNNIKTQKDSNEKRAIYFK